MTVLRNPPGVRLPAQALVRRVVLVTASDLEPRSFGKQVVLGGMLDHLVERLGGDQVHVAHLRRSGQPHPPTAYRRHEVTKPTAGEQARAAMTRVLGPARSSLQEAALWSPRVLGTLAALLDEIDPDLEIWDTMRTGQYVRALSPRRRVLYADDLFSKRYTTMLQQFRSDPGSVGNPLGEFGKQLPRPARRIAAQPWAARPLLQLEQRRSAASEDAAPSLFDVTLLVNPEETEELRQRTGDPAIHTVLPLLPEPAPRIRQFDGRPTFVFLGGLDFPPNRDGLSWFLSHCREEVLRRMPDFRLLLVGRGTDQSLPEASGWGSHVQPLGWVDDLDDVLYGAAGLLSPLRMGSGIKIKVLEALSRGLPVVATTHGVLGLGVRSADGCLVAQSPEQLARALAEASDPLRNEQLSRRAAATWERRFSPAAVRGSYDEVLGLVKPADRPAFGDAW